MSICGVLSRCLTWRRILTATAVLTLSAVCAGASWGAPNSPAPTYDPTTDPYSLLNITAGTGAQAWWNAGYTGKGVDVAVIDTGVAPVAGLNTAGQDRLRPRLSLESQASGRSATSTRTGTARSWPA